PVVVSPSTGTGQCLHGPQWLALAHEFGDAFHFDVDGEGRGAGRSVGSRPAPGVACPSSFSRPPWAGDAQCNQRLAAGEGDGRELNLIEGPHLSRRPPHVRCRDADVGERAIYVIEERAETSCRNPVLQ